MIPNAKCPRCGSNGRNVSFIGKESESGIFKPSHLHTTILAFKCKCGMAFTVAVPKNESDQLEAAAN